MRFGSDHGSPNDEEQQVKQMKTTRIQSGGLRVHWARFKKRLGTGSTFSESLLDGTGDSSNSSHSRKRSRSARRSEQMNGDDTDDNEEVDEVVVDNLHGAGTASVVSGQNGTSRHEVASGCKTHSHGTMETQRSDSSREANSVFTFFRWTLWPLVYYFFTMHFMDADSKMERSFRREIWVTNKTLGIHTSIFFILQWILTIALSSRPFALSDKIFFYGVGCLISVPLPFLIIYDVPYKRPIFYQFFLTLSVWTWGCYMTGYMYACDFYMTRTGSSHCGSRDFISILL